ncbi:Nitrous oxide reductase maturation protein, outer-membrane lipoprotein NosL [hydrothermal vent metagenome]|uniref:Nitrous oxide reductase maturation protein, outer-membrane lipoprotein NosL n=1 Tax=hydrothermal vent metagenome TaxID=652676 RepID=A0A3B0TRU5_9ZZZZ
MSPLVFVAMLLPFLVLAGCQENASQTGKPVAITLTEEAAGHYCQMTVLGHEGPKAQIHLEGYPAPLWFSQVRDGIAYLKSPEKAGEVVAFYVNDMGAAKSWTEPGIDNWIDVEMAVFVVGSDARGGMGAPEIVPFADKGKAEEFARERGGTVMALADIPAEAVLGPVDHDAGQTEGSG